MKRILVTLPTYNEAENIRPLIDGLLGLGIDGLEVLVMDDDSPDGTARLVEEKSREDGRVHLLLRTTNRGRYRTSSYMRATYSPTRPRAMICTPTKK